MTMNQQNQPQTTADDKRRFPQEAPPERHEPTHPGIKDDEVRADDKMTGESQKKDGKGGCGC